MIEWILLLMYTGPSDDYIRTVEGFASQQECIAAKKAIMESATYRDPYIACFKRSGAKPIPTTVE